MREREWDIGGGVEGECRRNEMRKKGGAYIQYVLCTAAGNEERSSDGKHSHLLLK